MWIAGTATSFPSDMRTRSVTQEIGAEIFPGLKTHRKGEYVGWHRRRGNHERRVTHLIGEAISFIIFFFLSGFIFLWFIREYLFPPSLSSCCLVAKSCQALCDLMGCSLPGSSVHEISQARILERVAFPCSKGSSHPRDWTCISCIGFLLSHWGAPLSLHRSLPVDQLFIETEGMKG